METTWYPHGNQVVSTEKPCCVNVVTTLCPHVYKNHMVSMYHVETMLFSCWEVLMLVDSEAVVRVSGAAETVDYFR